MVASQPELSVWLSEAGWRPRLQSIFGTTVQTFEMFAHENVRSFQRRNKITCFVKKNPGPCGHWETKVTVMKQQLYKIEAFVR